MSETYLMSHAAALSEFAPAADGTVLHGDCGEDAELGLLHAVDAVRWPFTGETLRAIVTRHRAHGWAAANGSEPLSAIAEDLQALGIPHTVYPYAEPFKMDWHAVLLEHAGRRPIVLQFANAGALPGDEAGVKYHFACVLGVNPNGYQVDDGDNAAARAGHMVTYSYADLIRADVCGMIVGPVVAHTGSGGVDEPYPPAASAKPATAVAAVAAAPNGGGAVSNEGTSGATSAAGAAQPHPAAAPAVDASGRPENADKDGLGPLMAGYKANHPHLGDCVSGGEFFYDTTPGQEASFAGFKATPEVLAGKAFAPQVLMTYKGQVRDDIGGYGMTALYALLRGAQEKVATLTQDLTAQSQLAANAAGRASDLQGQLAAAQEQITAMTHQAAELQAQVNALEDRATSAEAAASDAQGTAAPAANLIAALTAALLPGIMAALEQGPATPATPATPAASAAEAQPSADAAPASAASAQAEPPTVPVTTAAAAAAEPTATAEPASESAPTAEPGS